jgi:hypothetical protein
MEYLTPRKAASHLAICILTNVAVFLSSDSKELKMV